MDIPRVLTIAGSDSSGGAGIQADLKTIAYHGCFGLSAVTAVTAQNKKGVLAIEPVSAPVIREQIQAVINDIGVDAIKIGMLPSAQVIKVVAEELKKIENVPVVFDPVMAASSGAQLITGEASALKELLPLSLIVTPNLAETKALTKQQVRTDAEVEKAGYKLVEFGATHVLIKGGHRNGQTAHDCLLSAKGAVWFQQRRIHSRNTHGTGCTLATAIACFLAKDYSPADAVRSAKAFLTNCLLSFQKAPCNAAFPTYRRDL